MSPSFSVSIPNEVAPRYPCRDRAFDFPLRRAGAPPLDGEDAARYFKTVGYSFLDISVEHAAASGHLKTVHADPFDRLLIAQAVTEPLTLITRDSKVASYSPTFITW
ncbi:hypothetical protein GGD55_000987 [Rhizobium giardinii]|jgi:hypothetical protein|uniref:Type II toxin-antitoxin system VapC family toxin n=1 Tax=Rhizobium giardinii TaxID=56731 RepID=A0A7W8U7L3_9HYPH|nr:hypothetical protein [Rhizobium giardinii]